MLSQHCLSGFTKLQVSLEKTIQAQCSWTAVSDCVQIKFGIVTFEFRPRDEVATSEIVLWCRTKSLGKRQGGNWSEMIAISCFTSTVYVLIVILIQTSTVLHTLGAMYFPCKAFFFIKNHCHKKTLCRIEACYKYLNFKPLSTNSYSIRQNAVGCNNLSKLVTYAAQLNLHESFCSHCINIWHMSSINYMSNM